MYDMTVKIMRQKNGQKIATILGPTVL